MDTDSASTARRLLLSLLAGLLLVAPLGCSFSKSSSDSSESSSDSSASSSASSSPASKESQYRDDVRDYTAAYVKSGGQIADFKLKVGELAKNRGITNWEDNMATYEGIGQGLAKAEVSGVALDTYVTNLSGGDPNKAAAIRKGYASYKK
ncbi:MAG TPA: putative lipoprotein [Candidatus Methylomirabilis sp.]|nr:putative lipoprotein [Candidatus Methylomirabilis sp.]